MRITCTDLTIAFTNGGETVTALAGVSLESKHGEFLTLIGPSGCGKTTLLRALAGILKPHRGSISFDSRPNGANGQRLMVYQEDSLFPWMTVLENAAFGLEMKGVSKGERNKAALEMLHRYGLRGREGAYPSQISAGMKQRVAVIRGFLSDPELFLMDEPFGALDSPTRSSLQSDLLDLWSQSFKSIVFVTHDVDEAIYLSDRVLIMSAAPGSVVGEVKVDLPRDGRREAMLSEHFLSLKRDVLRHLVAAHTDAAEMEACNAA